MFYETHGIDHIGDKHQREKYYDTFRDGEWNPRRELCHYEAYAVRGITGQKLRKRRYEAGKDIKHERQSEKQHYRDVER